MNSENTQSIRNIIFAGPKGSGKTTLLEAILFQTKNIHSLGSIESKNTFSDFTDEEHEQGQSIYTTYSSILDKNLILNVLDSPGHPDFIGQATQALPAVDSFCLVLAADEALNPHAIALMEYAKKLHLCRAIIINKIDSTSQQCKQLVEQIQNAFGKECLPINLPAKNCSQVADVFFHENGDSDLGKISTAHQKIIDQVIEVDDSLMEQYLSGGKTFASDKLHNAFELCLRQGHLVPIIFTSARSNDELGKSIGIQELILFFENLLPNPTEANFKGFIKKGVTDQALHVTPDKELHPIAHACMIRNDSFKGKISYCRVHQGLINPGTQLFIGTPGIGESKKTIKLGHLYRPHGNELIEIDQALPGEIIAISRINEIHTNTVLHAHHDEDDIYFDSIELPKPLFGRAIKVVKKSDEQRFADAVAKLADEDPSILIERDPVTHEIIIYAVGELHLRIAIEKLTVKTRIELDVSQPKISYRETLRSYAEGHYRHKKQSGGAGQFAEVYLKVEPLDRGCGFEFVNKIVGGVIPSQYIPAVEKGVRAALSEGALCGYPIQDLKVTAYDGKHHPVDSKEIAFFTAAKKAFVDAFIKASPCLLEPVMKVTVNTPSEFFGELTGNIVSKRGRIIHTTVDGYTTGLIQAEIPLSNLQNYQSELKGLTAGLASFTMEFSGYDFVPDNITKVILSDAKNNINHSTSNSSME
jgi:elongation factor G